MTPLIDPKDRQNIAVRFYTPPTAKGRKRPRILLLKLDHIGDFVAAIAAFRLLRQAFAGAEITLICLPSIVPLAESTGLFDKVKGFAAVTDSPHLAPGSVPVTPEQIAVFRTLLDEPYFLAADFRHDPFNRFGLDHVAADYRAAFAAQTQKGLDIVIPIMEWDTPVARVAAGGNLPPPANVRLTLLAYAIIETLLEQPLDADLFKLAQDVADMPAYRALEAVTRFKIGLSVGAGSVLRKWPTAYWAALIEQLVATHNPHLVFFGSTADRAETQALAAALTPDRFTDLTGQIPLAEAPLYIDKLDAYIGCDTGLTHLAGNLNLPVLDIFAGISNISVWRARGPKVRAVYAEVACAPCHKRLREECPNENICMTAISPETVGAAFEQVLAL